MTMKLTTRLLVALGLRSACCGARMSSHGYDKDYCSDCGSVQ